MSGMYIFRFARKNVDIVILFRLIIVQKKAKKSMLKM